MMLSGTVSSTATLNLEACPGNRMTTTRVMRTVAATKAAPVKTLPPTRSPQSLKATAVGWGVGAERACTETLFSLPPINPSKPLGGGKGGGWGRAGGALPEACGEGWGRVGAGGHWGWEGGGGGDGTSFQGLRVRGGGKG